MSDLSSYSDEEIAREEERRHRSKMRYRRAQELVRERSASDKRMTLAQSMDACNYIIQALGISRDDFANAILAHAGCQVYFADWTELPPQTPSASEPQD